MKHVDMRSNMEHFSKVRKGQQDHGQPSHFDNENNGLFPRVLDDINPFVPEPLVTARADPGPFYPL